jgi:hypothetical protein
VKFGRGFRREYDRRRDIVGRKCERDEIWDRQIERGSLPYYKEEF